MIFGVWKYIVWRDDMICFVNGEMFNFVIIEGIIWFSKYVIEVVIFGVGCDVFGVLIVFVVGFVEKLEDE